MIIRRRRRDNFAIVPNHIWDEHTRVNDAGETVTLSFEAKGLLAYLLGRPEDWTVNVTHLRRVVGCGRDKAYLLINELIDFGYASRNQARDEASGRHGSQEITIYDEPLPGNQEPGESPRPELPLTANKEAYKERSLTNLPLNPPRALTMRFATYCSRSLMRTMPVLWLTIASRSVAPSLPPKPSRSLTTATSIQTPMPQPSC